MFMFILPLQQQQQKTEILVEIT